MLIVVALAPLAHAGPECVVKGDKVEGFAVVAQSKGGPSLKLYISGVKATARPPDRLSPEKVARIDVMSALAFSATAPMDHVPYQTARAVEATNGMVHLPPGVSGFTLRGRGSKWAEGDLRLGTVTVHGLILPCDALTLDSVDAPAVDSPDTAKWEPSGESLKLRGGAGSGATLDIEVGKDRHALEMSEVERHGPFTRVTARFGSGVTITGWAKQTDLKARSPAELNDAVGLGHPCKPRKPEAQPGGKLIEAKVAAGTPLSADRLFPWATAQSDKPLLIRYQPNESWVEIVSVPGIVTDDGNATCSTVLDEAWIPRAAVKWPSAPDGGAPPPKMR